MVDGRRGAGRVELMILKPDSMKYGQTRRADEDVYVSELHHFIYLCICVYYFFFLLHSWIENCKWRLWIWFFLFKMSRFVNANIKIYMEMAMGMKCWLHVVCFHFLLFCFVFFSRSFVHRHFLCLACVFCVKYAFKIKCMNYACLSSCAPESVVSAAAAAVMVHERSMADNCPVDCGASMNRNHSGLAATIGVDYGFSVTLD